MNTAGLTIENERIPRAGNNAADVDQREDSGDDRPQLPSNTNRDEEASGREHPVQGRGCPDQAT